MNRDELAKRVMLLQQNVEIQSMQLTAQADSLKVLRGHLAEAQHWLDKCPIPVPANEGENNNAIEEGNQPEGDISEHQDGSCRGEATESSSSDCIEQGGEVNDH